MRVSSVWWWVGFEDVKSESWWMGGDEWGFGLLGSIWGREEERIG